jgi:hypothetical protein
VLTTPRHNKFNVTKHLTRPWTSTDSLVIGAKQQKMDMRFGMWNLQEVGWWPWTALSWLRIGTGDVCL